MADTALKKKKLEVMEFPKISTSITHYDNKFKNDRIMTASAAKPKSNYKPVAKVKKKTKASTIKIVLIYVIIFSVVAFTKIGVMYEISNLGVRKNELEQDLSTIKIEVEELENTFVSNYDLKQVEKKAKAKGFVPKETIKYVNINN